MGSVIGETLPLALGIAISPIPIVATILMLLSPRAKVTSLAFLAGWLIGIVVAVVAFTLLSSILPKSDPGQAKPIAGVIKIILGALLLLLSARELRSRPKEGEEPAAPRWMGAIDSMTAGRALAAGLLLSALNPKNLLLAIAAGTALGAAALSIGEDVVAVVIFTVIAGSTVGGAVVAYLLASGTMTAPLRSLHGWLLHNNATVMGVLLLVIGVAVIGKGIGSF